MNKAKHFQGRYLCVHPIEAFKVIKERLGRIKPSQNPSARLWEHQWSSELWSDDLVRGPGGTIEPLRLGFLRRLRKGCAWSVSGVMSRETGRNDESITGELWKRQGGSSDCAYDGGSIRLPLLWDGT